MMRTTAALEHDGVNSALNAARFVAVVVFVSLTGSCGAQADAQPGVRDASGECTVNRTLRMRIECIERLGLSATRANAFEEPERGGYCAVAHRASTIIPEDGPYCGPTQPAGHRGLEMFSASNGEGAEASFVRYRTASASWSVSVLFETLSTSGSNTEYLGDCVALSPCPRFALLRCPVNGFVDGAEVAAYERDHLVMTFTRDGDGLRPEFLIRGSSAQIDAMESCYR